MDYKAHQNKKKQILFPLKIPLDSGIFLLEQLQLLSRSIHFHRFLSIKKFNIPKLLIRNTHDSDIPMLRKKRFNSFYMYGRILATSTMADINRKLKHRKSISL